MLHFSASLASKLPWQWITEIESPNKGLRESTKPNVCTSIAPIECRNTIGLIQTSAFVTEVCSL
ncbi:hypothetical protein CGMCC3_g7609 [Colletotrichum fructicola]|nr:uncharacterized protein CGMCC3_g7609 [Colletotrichum fructicola]KAE9576445.1 hypothetical protein CGMCC3_g7609 [Colletotrichum fructicola]